MHLQKGPAAAAVRLRSPGSPAHRTTASIPHTRTDAHIHIHGSGIILGEAKRISANLGESRRISANLGEPQRASTDLDASRRILTHLGASRRLSAFVHVACASVTLRERHRLAHKPAGGGSERVPRRFLEGSQKRHRLAHKPCSAAQSFGQRRTPPRAASLPRYVLNTPT